MTDGFVKKPIENSALEVFFLNWLRNGSHLFHTSGKAGSRKSTLMKFIWQDPSTRSELEAWAHPKKLVFAHFYFWKSSKDQWQMTLHGLYSSILYEILSQCPDLMCDLFPRQWQTFYAERGQAIRVSKGHFSDSQ